MGGELSQNRQYVMEVAVLWLELGWFDQLKKMLMSQTLGYNLQYS